MATGHYAGGVKAAYTNSTPTSDIDRAVHKDHLTRPAIVEASVRSFSLLQQQAAAHFKACHENGEAFLRDHNELKARYKAEGFKTWNDCCLATYGVTDDAIRKRILKICPDEQPTTVVKQEERCLKQVENARKEPEPQKPTEGKAEPPAPARAAPPQAKPKDNGKPLSQLSLWSEMEQSLIGRAINRSDELNRHCPNRPLRDKLQRLLGECLITLEQWRKSVL